MSSTLSAARRRGSHLLILSWLLLAAATTTVRQRAARLQRQRGALGLEWAWIAAGVCVIVAIVYLAVKNSTTSGSDQLTKNLP